MTARPTTVAARTAFAALSKEDRTAATALAKDGIASGLSAKDAWTAALAPKPVAPVVRRGGMPTGHHFTRVVGHRLISITKFGGACSCGLSYESVNGPVRAQHASHKVEDAA